MSYVDLMVTPVMKKRLAEYRKLAKKSAKIWKKHGAIGYCEMIEDDVKPGKLTSLPQGVKLKKGEVVAATYILYKNRKARDACWKKIMSDPYFANFDMKKAPFDAQRMVYGGFKSIVAF
jgi:uncharacterized protein YbaA (DUF1428 family)